MFLKSHTISHILTHFSHPVLYPLFSVRCYIRVFMQTVRIRYGQLKIFLPSGRKTGEYANHKTRPLYGRKIMITVTDIRNVNHAAYDEVWAIVRSLKNPGRMKHVPELSPSWALFKKYMQLRHAGQWNADTFKSVYVPVFLKEMSGMEPQRKLSELARLDRQGKRICLCCFCRDETLCHRSIIAGILQCAGIRVQGIKGDYSKYGGHKEIECHL